MLTTEKTSKAGQSKIVRNHFADASGHWGDRYGRKATTMADLDLLLRRENVHRLLFPLLQSSERKLDVFDVGCGSGDVLDGVPRDSIRVVGMDFVHEMVRQAQQTHAADRFMVGDATALPVNPASIDVITSLGVLEYIPEPRRTIESMATALRPGGYAIISFPNKSSLFRRMLNLERKTEQILVSIRNRLRGQTVPRTAAPYRHTQWRLSEARRLLESAGLEIDEVLLNTFGPWGRLGRKRFMVRVSEWLSRQMPRPGFIATRLACTIVIRARKPDGGHADA